MRRENDAYYSQSWIVDALLAQLCFQKPWTKIVEPSNGSGVISKRLIERSLYENHHNVFTSDLVQGLGDYQADFFGIEQGDLYDGCDWIITNPPYKSETPDRTFLASDYAKLSLQRAEHGVALFLRMSFLEPCDDRVRLLTGKMHGMRLTKVISCPRVSFTDDGKTDSVSCGWFVWEKTNRAKKELCVFTKEERDEVVTGQRSLI